MAIKKIIALFCAVFALMFIFGCAMGSQNSGNTGSGGNLSTGGISKNINGDYGRGYFYMNGGTNFIPQGNPLFNIRNSSDPAICVYRQPVINKDVLMMVTSCDLENVESLRPKETYPMNTTYLYTTSNLDGKWYDHGAVLQESDFFENNGGWSKQDANHLWAPDIQFVPEQNKFYLYVPAIDKNGIQHIGIASADVNSRTDETAGSSSGPHTIYYGICNKFTPQKSYFKILQGNSTMPHGEYAYDPGVFYDDRTESYYMSYCDYGYTGNDPATDPDGRIRIAKMDQKTGGVVDMTQATDIGQIQFQNPIVSGGVNLNTDVYMEGPDICKFTTYRTPRYYLIFAAKVPGIGTERIGYAMASEADFTNNPANCWFFKGWIMSKVNGQEDSNDFWTNHADFGRFNSKFYIFYHKIVKDSAKYPGSINRQVCIDEITLNEGNGEIILPIIGSSDGDGTSNGPFVRRLQNDQTENYLTVTSNSDYPAATCQYTHGDWTSQQWTYMAGDYVPAVFKNNWSGLTLATTGTGDYAAVECHVTSTDVNSDEAKKQKWEKTHNPDGTYSFKNVFSGMYLTCTGTSQGTYEGAPIACQPLHKDSSGNPDWSSQKWRLNGNRLNNVWSNRDLTCTGKYGATVKAQPLDVSWGSQKWVVETILDSNGYATNLRNFWSGKYLFEYNGTAICHTEGTLPNGRWGSIYTYSPSPSPENGRILMNLNTNTCLSVTNGSGSIDYANVECQQYASATSQIWHFK